MKLLSKHDKLVMAYVRLHRERHKPDDWYNQFGEGIFTHDRCARDILLIGGITSETWYMIIQKIHRFAMGDPRFELGRLLKYRHEIIKAKLN